jgi:hypothetical protein
MKGSFEWRGEGGAGYRYGFFREGSKSWRLAISLPGKAGSDFPRDKKFNVYVQGDLVASENSLKAAQEYLTKFFKKGLHHDLGQEPVRKRSLTEKLAAVVGLERKGRGR